MIASLYQRGSVALASFFTLQFSTVPGCACSRCLLVLQQVHLNAWTTKRYVRHCETPRLLCAATQPELLPAPLKPFPELPQITIPSVLFCSFQRSCLVRSRVAGRPSATGLRLPAARAAA